MGVADDCARTHLDKAVHKIESAFVHFLEKKDRSFGLGRQHDHNAHQVRGKLRPWPVVDARYDTAHVATDPRFLAARQEDVVGFYLELHAETLENTVGHPPVATDRVANRELATCGSGKREKTACFDVVGRHLGMGLGAGPSQYRRR